MLTPKEYVERIRKLRKLHRTGLLKADWYRQDRIAAICLCIRATQVYLKVGEKRGCNQSPTTEAKEAKA